MEATTQFDGGSFAPSLHGGAAGRDEVFVDVMNEGYVTRKGPWKFVLNVSVWNGEKTHKIDELFNLDDDPLEMNNLVLKPEHAERVRAMTNRIFQWLEDTGHPHVAHVKKAAALPTS